MPQSTQSAILIFSLFAAAHAAIPSVLLNNGVEMPVLAAGTWQYTTQVTQEAVAAAITAGFRHIDTAHDYCADGSTADCKGNSNQKGVGAGIKASGIPRAELFVTTKIPGCGLQGISRNNCGPDSVAAAEENLVELGLDYVDLLLVHFPPAGGCGELNCNIIKKQWSALQALLAGNKTRALGVSNFCISCFKCLAEDQNAPVPSVNQIKFHIGMGADPEGLLSYCKSNGVVVEAYSPLGDNTTELITGALTTSIAHAHNKSSVQVALKWIWQHGIPLTTKSSSLQHLAEDLDLFAWALSDAEMSKLDSSTSPAGTPSFMCSS